MLYTSSERSRSMTMFTTLPFTGKRLKNSSGYLFGLQTYGRLVCVRAWLCGCVCVRVRARWRVSINQLTQHEPRVAGFVSGVPG